MELLCLLLEPHSFLLNDSMYACFNNPECETYKSMIAKMEIQHSTNTSEL